MIKNYYTDTIDITEELHAAINSVLNSDIISSHGKNNMIAKTARRLIEAGEDTGLEDSKPKKGSSRAVYFPKDKKQLHIDGHPTEMHTVVKVAFPGTLDKHTGHSQLLGEMQNEVEADHFSRQHYGLLRKDSQGKYTTNHSGIFAPVVAAHGDDGEGNHHWLEMGRVTPLKSGDFKRLTKTPEFPKGISHQEFFDAVNRNHAEAHGMNHISMTGQERHDEVVNHPLVESAINATLDTGMHPGDLVRRNMGVWVHPHTGKEHVVISDYGFTDEIGKAYTNARRAQHKMARGW